MLVGEYYQETHTKYLIQATVEDLRNEASCPGHLTDIPIEIRQHATTQTLRKSLVIFAIKNNIQLKDPFLKIKRQRKGDRFLMLLFLDEGYRGKDLNKLNVCRQFNGATLLSDIVGADGISILPSYLDDMEGKRKLTNESIQPPHHLLDWDLWKKALHPLIERGYKLKEKLDHWFRPPSNKD